MRPAALAVVAAGLAALAAASGPARAQESAAVTSARAAGIVGERYDGYLGLAGAATPELRRQVEAINIRRRTLYIELGRRRGASAAEVAITAGCQLLARVPVGGAYLLGDGRWRRRAGDEDIRPEYCRG